MFDYSVTPVQQTLVCKIIHTECMYVQLSYVQSNCNRGMGNRRFKRAHRRYVIFITKRGVYIYIYKYVYLEYSKTWGKFKTDSRDSFIK